MSDGGNRVEQARLEAATVREYALGSLDVDHSDVPRAAGLARDDDVRELLVFARQAWERHRDYQDDPEFWETSWATDRVEQAAAAAATDAVEAGNVSLLSYLTGNPEHQQDVSGLHSLNRLETWLLDESDCRVVYLADHMGAGKTEFAHLCVEVATFRSDRRDDLAPAEARCNIPSSEIPTITEFDKFKEWVESGDSDGNRWFVFDEASSTLTGYSQDREVVEQLLSGLVKLARKHGVNLIFIGHTGKDLHADLRRLSDYVEKPSKKKARIYKTVNRTEGQGHKFDLDRLPRSNLDFDTEDEAPWSWGDALDDDQDDGLDDQDVKRLLATRASGLYESVEDVTQKDAAEVMSGPSFTISRKMVQDALSGKYNNITE